MAVTRAQRARLGVFVATGTAVLVGGILLLAGLKLGQKRDVYTVRFSETHHSLSGLEVGAPVKYSGVRVGRVDSITVDPKDVSVLVVQLSLNGGTPVAEDSAASAGSLGITGLKYVELTRGSRTARIREPGEVIPEGPSLFDDLADRAEVVARKIESLLDSLSSITSPEMRAKGTKLVDSAIRLMDTTEATVAENRGSLKELTVKVAGTATQVGLLARDLRGTLRDVDALAVELRGTASRASALADDIRGTAGRVNSLFDESRPRMVHLLDETDSLVGEFRQTRRQLDLVLVSAQATLGEDGLRKTSQTANKLLERGNVLMVNGQEELESSLEHLRETAENLSVFSERIKSDPSLLLRGGPEEKGEEK
jgi:phospholipid/cholesterol/gamma-HCH transport system substrate-binding protein